MGKTKCLKKNKNFNPYLCTNSNDGENNGYTIQNEDGQRKNIIVSLHSPVLKKRSTFIYTFKSICC